MKFLSIFKRIPKTPEERKRNRRYLFLGFTSGILMGFSFPPIPSNYLMFFALVPYLYVLNKKEGLAEISRFTYFTMFFFNITTLYWVGSWTPDADPFLKMAGTILMFWNPILFLIPSTLFYITSKKFNKTAAYFLLPMFWVTYEYLYSITEFRFPWLTIANSQPYFLSFIQIADTIGAYGISLVILYINVLLFFVLNKYRQDKKLDSTKLVIASLLFILPLAYGIIKINTYEYPDKKIKIGIVQPDLNPWDKWETGNLSNILNLYLDMTEEVIAEDAQIVIWPETALPVYLMSGSYQTQVDTIFNFLSNNNISLLTGMPDANFYYDSTKAPGDAKKVKGSSSLYTSYNSVLLFNPNDREVQKYGKIKLVPFGEKVPYVETLRFLCNFLKWNVGISSWNTGIDTTVMTMPLNNGTDSVKIAGVVCIESIYPEFVSSFVKKGAEIIAVVTNDSWYGNSSGPYQHKEFSVLRAIENRRSVVRGANGGISCYIDPLGFSIDETEMFTKTTRTFDVVLEKELTFYTQFPLLIPILCSVVSIWIFGVFLLSIMIKKFYPHKINEQVNE